MPHLRPLQAEDNPQIAAIIRSVLAEFGANKPGTVYYDPTTDDLFSLFSRPDARYWVLEDEEGRLLGGSGIYPTQGLPPGCAELVKLYLLPSVRGKGYGRMLIEQCIQAAKELGYRQLYLETMPELSMAMSLYEKCGFHYLKRPLGNSGHFGCDLWMLREV